MKINNFVKQNILILVAAIFSLIVGMGNINNPNLYPLIFSILLLIYCPVAYVQYERLKTNKDIKVVDLILNILLWLFLVLSVFPFLYVVWGDIFFHSEFSPLVNLKLYFIYSGLDNLKAIIEAWMYNSYYLVITILIFLAIYYKNKIKITKTL